MALFDTDPVQHFMIDGRSVDPAAASLPAPVPGVLRGEGVFEAFCVDEELRTPFFLRHEERLVQSAQLLDLDLGGAGMAADWADFRATLPSGPWRVRYTVLRSAGGGLLRFWSAGRPVAAPEKVTLALAPFRRDPADPTSPAKTVSRASWQVARRRAMEAGAWDAILWTVAGDLSECTSSNLFLWHDGALRTPSEGCGILRGVTRRAVLEACREEGIPVSEEEIPVSRLEEAAEIFITSAVMGVLPVARILGHREKLPGASGPQLERVRAVFRAYVERVREDAPGSSSRGTVSTDPMPCSDSSLSSA